MNNFILDTNVFFAYADDNSEYHVKTHYIFNNNYELFTSKKVRREATSVIKRHREILLGLSDWASSKKTIKEYLDENLELDNDKRYFNEKMHLLEENESEEIIRNFKDLNKLTEIGIDEAFQKIINELIGDYQDIDLEQALGMHIRNQDDRHILVDVVIWHDNLFDCHFLTADGKDFLRKKREIRRTIANCTNCDIKELRLKIISYKDIKEEH